MRYIAYEVLFVFEALDESIHDAAVRRGVRSKASASPPFASPLLLRLLYLDTRSAHLCPLLLHRFSVRLPLRPHRAVPLHTQQHDVTGGDTR